MAIAINEEIEFKRDNIFNVNPDHMIVEPEENGRPFGLEQQKIVELAYKILKDGQKTPGKARRVQDNRLKLTAGNYRHAAICYINKHNLTEKPMWFRVEVVDQSPEKAFLENIIENRDRNQVSIVGDAKNIDRLLTLFSWSDDKICEFYGTEDADGKKPMSPAWLGNMRLLLRLAEKHLKLIDSGVISATFGRRLAEVAEEERDTMLEAAMAEAGDGKVTESDILTVVRRARAEKPDVTKAGKATSLRMPEVRKSFQYLTSPEAKSSPKMTQFAESFLAFQADKMPELEYFRTVRKLLGE